MAKTAGLPGCGGGRHFPPGGVWLRMETTLAGATAAEQSGWGLGASRLVVEVCPPPGS